MGKMGNTMKLTDILKKVIKEELDLGTDAPQYPLVDDDVQDYIKDFDGIGVINVYSKGADDHRNSLKHNPPTKDTVLIHPFNGSASDAANSFYSKYNKSKKDSKGFSIYIYESGPSDSRCYTVVAHEVLDNYTMKHLFRANFFPINAEGVEGLLQTVSLKSGKLVSNDKDDTIHFATEIENNGRNHKIIRNNREDVDREREEMMTDPNEHPRYNRNIREDIFLKKDPENKQIIVFSDKEDKRAAAKETISLAKEFRKLGLDWKPALGHWVGGYDKLAQVNGLIKSHNRIKEVIDDLEALEDFIASSDADPTAKSQIMDNLDKYIDDLANATDQTAMDGAIRNYLTFYSKFHNYSFINSMLIFMQKKDATKVAGYKTWKRNNRGVKKGAKAIWIWFPMKATSKSQETETDTEGVDFSGVDDAAKTRSFTKFGLGKVYDISDTYALNEKGEVPEKPNWAASNDPSEVADQLVERIKEFANDLGIKITKEKAQGGEKGFSAGGHINLSSDVQGVGAASVLVHELAHELLHWKEKSPFHVGEATRDMQELQAESVSYVVMKHYNLPVTQHPTYLVLWKANKDKIKANLQVIQKCAKYIIDGIDAQETPNSDQGGGDKEEK